jgi:hypothetical protein
MHLNAIGLQVTRFRVPRSISGTLAQVNLGSARYPLLLGPASGSWIGRKLPTNQLQHAVFENLCSAPNAGFEVAG